MVLQKPQVLKGHSPYSSPLVIREVLGNWTYLLSDGKVWNARRIKRYYEPGLQWATVETWTEPRQVEHRPIAPLQPFRRSERTMKGVPLARYMP